MGFPEGRPEANGSFIRRDRSGQISGSMQRDAHVVERVGIVLIAGQRFGVGMDSCLVLPNRIVPQTQVLVGLGIPGIDAQRGARLGDCVRPVIQPVEEIRQSAMVLGEIWHQLDGEFQFVVGIVKLLLLAQHHAQREVQRRIVTVGRN